MHRRVHKSFFTLLVFCVKFVRVAKYFHECSESFSFAGEPVT